MDALQAIRSRRSIARLVEPAPDENELQAILEAAACAPDHGKLRPFRFTLLRGHHADAFGVVLEEAYRNRCGDQGIEVAPAKAAKERSKLGRAPLVVVVSAVRPAGESTIPWAEQLAACAAACQNVLLAATALGYGSMWRTGEPCYDDRVKAALALSPHDAVVGFLYLGTVPEGASPRRGCEPDLEGLVREWRA